MIAFCGPEAAGLVSQRLDATRVAEFRGSLGKFYTHVFNINDPGFEGTPSADLRLLPIDQRFIVPDIEEQQTVATYSPVPPPPPDLQALPASLASLRTIRSRRLHSPNQRTIRRRLAADEWLGAFPKTSFWEAPVAVRYAFKIRRYRFAQRCTRTKPFGREWGTRLPVWVPFPAWTEKILDGQECSLPDLLRRHLRSWAEERLWPLVEAALDDERLLLVVDGLDEWVDESSAKRAADKLQVFLAQRNLPAIVASRPHGFARLGWQQTGWQMGQLAPFNSAQQRRFAAAWFKHRALGLQQTKDQATLVGDRDADSFVNELRGNANLRELAGIPLLLRIFIYFRLRNSGLPQNRFEAYERMVKQLISEHPTNRQRAAEISNKSELDTEDIRTALGVLAFEIHSTETGGVINKDQARTILENHLKDAEHGPGLDQANAARLSRRLLEFGQSTLGVLVERTPADVGFFHRSFQEHLTANHLSKMPFNDQLQFVQKVCWDVQWSEVILALCYSTKRPAEVRSFVEALQNYLQSASRANGYSVQRLVAEIALGGFNCPTPLAREIARTVFQEIEIGEWIPHRASLVRLALAGLRSTALREQVRERASQWFPCHSRYRAELLKVLSAWEPSEELLECFWRNLHDEDLSNRRAAAEAIASRYGGDLSIGNRVAKVAGHSISADPERAQFRRSLGVGRSTPILRAF